MTLTPGIDSTRSKTWEYRVKDGPGSSTRRRWRGNHTTLRSHDSEWTLPSICLRNEDVTKVSATWCSPYGRKLGQHGSKPELQLA